MFKKLDSSNFFLFFFLICITGYVTSPSNASTLHHVTHGEPIKKTVGVLFGGTPWLITPQRSKSFFVDEDCMGAEECSQKMGFNLIKENIELPQSPEALESKMKYIISKVSEFKKAGYTYFVPVFYLRENCCSQEFPLSFYHTTEVPAKDSPIGKGFMRIPVRENQNLTRYYDINLEEMRLQIFTHTYTVTKRLLKEVQLPIQYVLLGNETDGGFYKGFDAQLYPVRYAGAPAHIDLTRMIYKEARKGVEKAYKEHSLNRPYFLLHHMIDPNQTTKEILDNIKEHNKDLTFDLFGMSLYPNARATPKPEDLFNKIIEIGNQTGLPWSIQEFGIAQEKAPGEPGKSPYWVWNYHMDFWLDGTPLVEDFEKDTLPISELKLRWRILQADTLSLLFGKLLKEKKFFGALYLSPESAVISAFSKNETLLIHPPAKQYRLSLWEYRENVSQTENSPPSRIVKAYTTIKKCSEKLAGYITP